MLLKLKTGEVPGYNEGQEPLVYLVSNAQAVAEADLGFVFTDGHAYAAFSSWFDNLKMLAQVDWIAVASRYWGAQNDPSGELQRRKQAEFLVHGFLDWALIHEVAVIDNAHKEQVEEVLEEYGSETSVAVRREWYY